MEDKSDSVSYLLDRAGEMAENGDYKKAEKQLEEILKQKLTSFQTARAEILLGKSAFYEKKFGSSLSEAEGGKDLKDIKKHFDTASAMLDKVKGNDPDIQKERLALADTLEDSGFRDAAIKEYRKIIDRSPGSYPGIVAGILEAKLTVIDEDRATVLKKLGKAGEDLKSLPDSEKSQPMLLLGQTYYHVGLTDNAVLLLEKVIAFNPESDNSQEARIYLAWIMLKQGKPGKAASYLEGVSRAVKSKIAGGKNEVEVSGGVLFGMIVNTLENVPGNNAAINMLSKSIESRLKFGMEQFKRKNYHEAVDEIDRCIKMLSRIDGISREQLEDPNYFSSLLDTESSDPVLLLELGRLFLNRGEKDKAKKILTHLMNISPGSSQSVEAGNLMVQSGLAESGELEKLKTVMIKNSSADTPQNRLMFAMNYYEKADYKSAAREMEYIVKKFPSSQEEVQANLYLVLIYAARGDRQKAETILKNTEKKISDQKYQTSGILIACGDAYRAVGETTKAAGLYRKSIELSTYPSAPFEGGMRLALTLISMEKTDEAKKVLMDLCDYISALPENEAMDNKQKYLANMNEMDFAVSMLINNSGRSEERKSYAAKRLNNAKKILNEGRYDDFIKETKKIIRDL
ncbi:MAG: tetratricopeptide repeat protein [Chloroflexi bacterium]|nr:tetratricopeptide repeat protein [Chloroflexota bacterium]